MRVCRACGYGMPASSSSARGRPPPCITHPTTARPLTRSRSHPLRHTTLLVAPRQLEKIGDCLGPPNQSDLAGIDSRFTLEMLDQMAFPAHPLGAKERGHAPFDKRAPPPAGTSVFDPEASWRFLFPAAKAGDKAIELLCAMMRYEPSSRITAVEGLKHEYCAQFHEPQTEIDYDGSVRVARPEHTHEATAPQSVCLTCACVVATVVRR